MMASALLTAAAAAILLPITAAAASQIDAQRRVVAARFAANVMEHYIAGHPLQSTVTAEDLGYSESVYTSVNAIVTTDQVTLGEQGSEVTLILLTVKVLHGDRPITTLKTLVGSGAHDL